MKKPEKNTQTSAYEAVQIRDEKVKIIEDFLVVEAALQININTEPYTVVMRTPGNDLELIRGLLYAEDIYKGHDKLKITVVETQENGFNILNVSLDQADLGKGYLNKRTLLSVSSCGICGKQKLDDISLTGKSLNSNTSIKRLNLEKLFDLMKQEQFVFDKTGGSHSAAIFDLQCNLLVVREDIGRHNAVDKSIGALLDEQKLSSAEILLVSGRVSYEIISKAFIAKIPIIAAVSACSSLAVDFAKEFGIQLIGFTRNGNATVYANPGMNPPD